MAADEDDDESGFDVSDIDRTISSSSLSYDQLEPGGGRVLPFPMSDETRDRARCQRRRELWALVVLLAALAFAFDWRT